jgi:hypothetical protein
MKEVMMYSRNEALIHSGDYMEKQRISLLFRIVSDIYIDVINKEVKAIPVIGHRCP